MRRLVALLTADLHLGHRLAERRHDFAIVVFSTDIAPTLVLSVRSVAASRIALATFSGSIIGVGSFGSRLM